MRILYFLIILSLLNSCTTSQKSSCFNERYKCYCYTSIKKALNDKKDVQCLDLSSQKRLTLSDVLIKFTNLRVLNISDHNLTQIPPIVFQLRSLEVLIIDDNKISNISSDIKELTNLQELHLSGNPIYEFPPELVRLRKLKIVKATNIGFSDKEIESLKESIPKGCHLLLNEIMIDYFPPYEDDSLINQNE